MSDQSSATGIPEPEGAADIIDTDFEIGQHNLEGQLGPFGFDIHNPVFLVSGLSIIVFVLYALAAPEQAAGFFGWLRPTLTSTFDWFFLTSANIFVLFCLFLIVSPWGSVRLGGKDARPDYNYLGWFAMLFAAGMGIGLMFFGVLEPVYHMAISEPLGVPSPFAEDGSIIPENVEAAKQMGLAATIYHWGLHPWAIYAVVALALALFSFNKGLPLSIRSAFYPIFGERVWGWTGHVIDTLAVFATLFGLATSLGLGAQQANAGPRACLRHPQHDHRPGDPDRRHHRRRADLGAARPRRRRQGALRGQHGDRGAAAALRAAGRPRRRRSSATSSRDLPPMAPISPACRTRSGARTTAIARAGRPSTGPGGSPGRRSSACSSPASAAAAPCASSSPAC